jgi:hypothetical protein
MKPIAVVPAAVFLLAATCQAQQTSPNAMTPQQSLTAACGPSAARFSFKTEYTPQPDLPSAPGKAVVYFIQDDRQFRSVPRPTVLWAIDGTWVGATRGETFFRVQIDPGERHLCVRWYNSGETSLAHFTAQPGGVYFFSARNSAIGDEMTALEPLDTDEGALLVSQYAYSIATPKK